jgi:cytochrome c-type biogenesis protein CcmH/NrfF
VGFVVLLLVAVGLLSYGSIHSAPPSAAARIAALDQIIKCPSCADASLAQSETAPALELKATVARWVDEGLSNAAIEQRVTALYGPGELLRPSDPVVWILPLVAVVLALGGLGWFLATCRAPAPGATAVARPSDEVLVDEARRERAGR